MGNFCNYQDKPNEQTIEDRPHRYRPLKRLQHYQKIYEKKLYDDSWKLDLLIDAESDDNDSLDSYLSEIYKN